MSHCKLRRNLGSKYEKSTDCPVNKEAEISLQRMMAERERQDQKYFGSNVPSTTQTPGSKK